MEFSFRSFSITGILLLFLAIPSANFPSMAAPFQGNSINNDANNKINNDNIKYRTDSVKFENFIDELSNDLDLKKLKLEKEALRLAMIGYFNLKHADALSDENILSIIDYQKSSNIPRFYVFDLKERKLLYQTLVSHGRNSGNEYARKFSNVPQSYTSSIGFYVTKQTYYGKHGYSLKLEGWDEGFNDKAEERAIVIHGADYVCNEFAKKYGRIGRSLGCPALPVNECRSIISRIKNRSCLFAYYPDEKYIQSSHQLNFHSAIQGFLKHVLGLRSF